MKVLVVGSGGREHALCWKIRQSPLLTELYCAPGNAGTEDVATNVPIQPTDLDGLVELARRESIDLVVVGPEDPLCAGLGDRLRAEGVPVFGPGAAGARLEGSKVFAKDLIERHRIPTAASRTFDRSGLAKGYLETCTTWPQVVKADGLAAGKGVYVCDDARAGCAAVDTIMEERRHGDAGTRVLIEEFLEGEEVSVFAITDGNTILILEPVTDHKQVGDGDVGPNTGGMGVFSPVPTITKRIHKQIEQRVLVPSIHALRHEGIEFRGVLFCGLMITEAGPRILEYNVRFGDPECQALMCRLQSDILPLLLATAEGKLDSIDVPEWDPRACVGVVAAAEGYPGPYRKGDIIRGLDVPPSDADVVVFQAGTCFDSGNLVTNGGRVLCVAALGDEVEDARNTAYAALQGIAWDGMHFRHDIGRREETRKRQPLETDGGTRF